MYATAIRGMQGKKLHDANYVDGVKRMLCYNCWLLLTYLTIPYSFDLFKKNTGCFIKYTLNAMAC